ncbi:MAG: substrate-binding domain-containing protein [Spirochaetia bacterium]|nr:substrate-binding domain-containing protein [Spirochaetia bacterium]
MRPDILTQKFIEDLTRSIRERNLKGHELIEGQDELGKKFGVSYTTVRKGLKTLIDQKIIYRVKGKGTFVAPREHFSIRNYFLVLVNPGPGKLLQDVWQRFLSELRGEALAEGYFLTTFTTQSDPAEIRKMCYEDQVRGAFFVDIPHGLPSGDELAGFLKKRGLPVIHIEEKPGEKNSDTVSLDHTAAGRLSAEHLADGGRRRIAFVSDKKGGIFARRIKGFMEGAAKRGVRGEVIHFSHLELLDEKTIRRFDGMAFSYEGVALTCLELCRRFKIGIPKDLAVVAIDGSPLCRRSTPALSSVTQPLSEMARGALEKILLMIRPSKPLKSFPLLRLLPKIEKRGSS